MGNTIKRMFAPRVPEGQQQQQQPQQLQQQPQQLQLRQQQQQLQLRQQQQQPQQLRQQQQQQQPRQIHHTMPQISNLKNIKPVSWKNAIPFIKKGKQIVQLKTHLNNKSPNNTNINIPNKKCIRSKFVFYFIRHAESCSNQQQTKSERYFSKLKKFNSGSEIEPFISDKGILDCDEKKSIYTDEFKKNISNYFCSCLQRAWNSGYLLFGKDYIEKFMIGPYLREDADSPSNLPVLYNENVWRFNFFKEYSNKLIEHVDALKSSPNSSANSQKPNSAIQPQSNSANQSQPNSASQPQPNSANSSQKNRQNSKNCPRYSGDGSALYPPIYYESDLDKFILWYIENFKLLNKCNNSNNSNKEIKVVVVCHSHIIQEFVEKRMTIDQFNKELEKKKIRNITQYKDYFKKYFNYCISVNVEYNTSQNTRKEILKKYNENYNKSLDLLQGSEYSNTLKNGNKNKLQTSVNIMKTMVPICGFGNICVRKIRIFDAGSSELDHLSDELSPICKFSKNVNFSSKIMLEKINDNQINIK